jgi:hypothetical protein
LGAGADGWPGCIGFPAGGGVEGFEGEVCMGFCLGSGDMGTSFGSTRCVRRTIRRDRARCRER